MTFWRAVWAAVLAMIIYGIISWIIGFFPFHSRDVKVEGEKPATYPCLKLQFADGKQADVCLTFTIQLVAQEAPRVHLLYGSQGNAVKELKNNIEGSVYSVLERYTIDYVRKNREDVERRS